MRRVVLASSLFGALAALAAPTPARADFDPERGTVVRSPDAAIAIGFEGSEASSARAATAVEGALPTLDGAMPEAWLGAPDAGAVEGARAVRVPAGRMLVLGGAASFGSVQDARIELRFWARADGARPSGRLVYAPADVEARDLVFPNAAVEAIETGRATSDGWVEYSTGPVDAQATGRTKAAAVVLETDAGPQRGSGFWVDGVEVRRVGPRPARASACTLATEDAACGDDGACVLGACFDSTLVWGALPSAAARRAIVRRQEQYLVRFTSDRAGAARAAAIFSPRARAAAAAATSSRGFWQPFERAAAESRGAHTRAVGPSRYHRLAWHSLAYARSQWNELLACFGAVERDLDGGGRGFAVFAAAPSSPLLPGDLVTAIDGEDPRAWLARTAPIAPLAADGDADLPMQGAELQQLVTALARSLEVVRYSGAIAKTITVDLADLRAKAATLPWQTQPRCSVRFRRGVDVPAGADPEAYEAAFESVDEGGVAHVMTNGEPPGPELAKVVERAFDRSPTRMIVDKRRGDGGGGESLEVWGARVRRDPSFRMLFAGRWAWDTIDPPASVFAELVGCDDPRASAPACWATGASFAGVAPRGSTRPAKIAWLNLVDGSASDMATAYAKGVAGVRIFAPTRTIGLFGGLQHVPRFASGLSDGYIQRGDTRIGSTWAEVTAAPWQSGRGIEPDEVILQRHSDVLAGRDTMLERAKAWLAE